MSRIVVEAERNIPEDSQERRRRSKQPLSIAETICESIAHAAQGLDMGAIAVFTESGNTAKLISKYRPKPEIFAFSHIPHVCNRLNLLWGVHPVFHAQARSGEAMVATAERVLLRRGRLRAGEVLGVVAGTQLASGSTNFMRLHVVMNPEASSSGNSAKKTRTKRTRD
jgi:pyruvate kinase